MEIINNRVCMTASDLDGIIAIKTLQQLVYRGQAERAQRGCKDRASLFYVDSLPYKYRTEVHRRFPDLESRAESRPFTESVEPDGEAYAFYEGYTFANGSHLTPEKIEEYSNNAAVLNSFRRWLEVSNGMRSKTGHRKVRKGEFWAMAAKAVENMADTFPNTLPSNERRLQEKFNDYERDGYVALISGKHGNSNAAKVETEAQKAAISALCAIPNGLSNAFVARQYNDVMKRTGGETITAGTVGRLRKENGLAIDAMRHGSSHFSNTHAMQVSRTRPTAAMLLWSLDGWDAELYYQKRNAKGVVTYNNRKVLEVVLDACCDYPIGYAIGDQEDSQLIAEALRNAANHTRELFGSRYMTCQLQSDHYALKTMTPYYSTVADKVTPARVRNAKSKPVERYFLDINERYCKTQQNWSGYGITAKKEHQPNTEYHNLVKKNFPDEEGVIRQLEEIIAVERASKLEEYMKFWELTPADRRLPLPDERFLLRFGRSSGRTNVLQGQGMCPRIGGVRRQYECFDISFRDKAYLRWDIRYDESDLSHVLAVSEDGKYRYMLEEKYLQPMALADRKEGDALQLERVRDYNRALTDHTSEMFLQISEHARPLISGMAAEALESPDARNVLAKELLTDSRGQHKSRRAGERRRLAAAAADAEDIQPVAVPVVVENAPAGENRVNTFDLY